MSLFEDTWLIVPVYNESQVLGTVLAEARQTFPHIVCIDDGSTDGSGKVALDSGCVLVRHPINLGQGAALQTGFQFILDYTDATYAVTFDSDGQHQVSDVVAMVETARTEDLSIVFGSRFLEGKSEASLIKRVVLRLAAWITTLKTGMHLTDAHNGLRLLRRDALRAVDLRQNRMAHASEIVSQIAKSGLRWKEMPVHIKYTDYSRSKGQSLLNSINILVDLMMGRV